MAAETSADIEPRRVAAWTDLAEHFLDTETRHRIPGSALLLVELGFSTDEARAIWEDEVTPAVAFNLSLVAGEWAGWDEEWLVERIVARSLRRGSWVQRVGAWLAPSASELRHGIWTAIERCMGCVQEAGESDRRRVCGELELLARLFFDFCPPDVSGYAAAEKRRLIRLYHQAFWSTFSPLVVPSAGESPSEFGARVELALEAALEVSATRERP